MHRHISRIIGALYFQENERDLVSKSCEALQEVEGGPLPEVEEGDPLPEVPR